jgi:hypothetical protein
MELYPVFYLSSKQSLLINPFSMKHFFFVLASTLFSITMTAQNSSTSRLVFNPVKGLTVNNKLDLNAVYQTMNDLKYHCFHLVNEQEQSRLQPSKLAKLVKERAVVIMDYYKESHQIKAENMFVKYDGGYPILWIHKPKSLLTAIGKITLEENDKQCFDFNPSIDETITTANGNMFYFPWNAFETLDGVTIQNKNIIICVWEFAEKKHLVYAGLTTEANGKLLETGGSFYITAYLVDKELKLKAGKMYTVEIPVDQPHKDMFTFYGHKKDGIINWNVNKNEPVMVYEGVDVSALEPIDEDLNEDFYEEGNESEQAINYYELSAGKLGWINCDRFYETKETSPLMVKINTKDDVVVRLVFRTINSVLPAYSNSNHKDLYEATGLPSGEKVLLLAYAVKDNNAVFGYKEIVIGENLIETISLESFTKSRFKSAVSELLSY